MKTILYAIVCSWIAYSNSTVGTCTKTQWGRVPHILHHTMCSRLYLLPDTLIDSKDVNMNIIYSHLPSRSSQSSMKDRLYTTTYNELSTILILARSTMRAYRCEVTSDCIVK